MAFQNTLTLCTAAVVGVLAYKIMQDEKELARLRMIIDLHHNELYSSNSGSAFQPSRRLLAAQPLENLNAQSPPVGAVSALEPPQAAPLAQPAPASAQAAATVAAASRVEERNGAGSESTRASAEEFRIVPTKPPNRKIAYLKE